MELKDTRKNWDKLAQIDPFYGVASDPVKLGRKWEEKEFFLTGVQLIDAMLGYGAEKSIKIPDGNALDFGCGVGRLSQALSHRFEHVTGVDISATMIKLAREHDKSGGRCSFVLNEKNDLSVFAGETFDFVFTDMVLQHLDPRYAVDYIREFARVLKKGGLLVFQLPEKAQYSSVRVFLKKFVSKPLLVLYRRLKYGRSHTADVEVEMNGIDKKEVISMLDGLGLKVLDAEARYYWAEKPL
ncbi:MAG: class I SAM-dependent methyltransferase [Candidatus Goldiibacteriota bacterium]|jgi:ubiquinone/menaquinone biosynthesis C-methylase UbiE